MLQVITGPPYGSRFEKDMSRGIVVIESDLPLQHGSFGNAIAELESVDARHRAIGFAVANGVGDARINGNTSGVYPINAEGKPLDQVRDELNQPLENTHPLMQVHRYRIDVPVTRRLV